MRLGSARPASFGALLLASALPAGAGTSMLPLSLMPLDEARYCNASCRVDSCSQVCREVDDCDKSCTPKGHASCTCRHGSQK